MKTTHNLIVLFETKTGIRTQSLTWEFKQRDSTES